MNECLVPLKLHWDAAPSYSLRLAFDDDDSTIGPVSELKDLGTLVSGAFTLT